MDSLAEEIKKELDEKGSVSFNDIKSKASNGSELDSALSEDSTVKPQMPEDPLDKAVYNSPDTASANAAAAGIDNNQTLNSFGFGFLKLEEVEVSAEDKQRFVDSITSLEEKRFTKEFSIFGDNFIVIFKNRTVNEGRAILTEINRFMRTRSERQLDDMTVLSLDYPTLLKMAMLRFQLVSVNGMSIPEVNPEDLNSTFDFEKGKPSTPKWIIEMDKLFGKYQEGLLNALFDRLMEFESIYWTLIKNANNTNFWNPEESESA